MNNQNDQGNMIYFALSQDELAFLMGALNVAALPGFNIPDDYTAAHAEAARRSLLARLLIAIADDDTLAVVEPLQSTLRACARPVHVLSVTTNAADQAAENWFYILPGVLLLHRSPLPGVQQFVGLGEGDQMARSIASVLGMLDDNGPVGNGAQLPKALYDQVRAAAQAGDTAAAYALVGGYDNAAMQALIEPDTFGVLTLLDTHGERPVALDARLVLQSNASYWLVSATNDGAEMDLQPVSAEQVLITIAGMIAIEEV